MAKMMQPFANAETAETMKYQRLRGIMYIRNCSLHSILAAIAAILISNSLAAQHPDINTVRVTRLLDEPIIGPSVHPSIGENIQGPSLIRVPDWVNNPLGKYYLYFPLSPGI